MKEKNNNSKNSQNKNIANHQKLKYEIAAEFGLSSRNLKNKKK